LWGSILGPYRWWKTIGKERAVEQNLSGTSGQTGSSNQGGEVTEQAKEQGQQLAQQARQQAGELANRGSESTITDTVERRRRVTEEW
jgi:enamine deaminase RidA (YjgF/YER057c/UK114 family)